MQKEQICNSSNQFKTKKDPFQKFYAKFSGMQVQIKTQPMIDKTSLLPKKNNFLVKKQNFSSIQKDRNMSKISTEQLTDRNISAKKTEIQKERNLTNMHIDQQESSLDQKIITRNPIKKSDDINLNQSKKNILNQSIQKYQLSKRLNYNYNQKQNLSQLKKNQTYNNFFENLKCNQNTVVINQNETKYNQSKISQKELKLPESKNQIQRQSLQIQSQKLRPIFDKQINIDQFQFQEKIGYGQNLQINYLFRSYAIVYKAIEKSSQNIVAIKQYSLKKIEQKLLVSLKREIQILKSLSHNSIIKLHYAVQDFYNYYLIMEYPGQQSLFNYITQNSQRELQKCIQIFHQICKAVEYCHEKDICHRDIKSDNILMDGDNVKLIDFGFSIFCNNVKKLNIFCGTPQYMSPQIVKRINYSGKKSDIWSLGVLFYTLIYSSFPFKGRVIFVRFQ